MTLQLVQTNEAPTEVAADVLLIGAHEADGGASLLPQSRGVDEVLEGQLSEHLTRSGFKAKVGDTVLVPTFGRLSTAAVAVVGLGSGDAGPAELRRAAGAAARKLGQHAVAASLLHEGSAGDGAAAAAEGFHLGSYRFTDYKSEPKPSKLQRVLFLGEVDSEELSRAGVRAAATTLARDLANEPASTLSPEEWARRASDLAEASGLEATILDEDDLGARGFGGILGVAQGSDRPPRLIRLRHAPSGASSKLSIVGKGITFDSGGLSLKDAKGMETMKTDMAGGAAVFGVMSAVPKLGVDVEVTAIVPATDNMPGGRALRPGDVIRHYGGKSSEVLNTDAEGRLVLADALTLAAEERPDAVVDVATLTGAMQIALGRKVTGYFSNDEDLAKEIEMASTVAGERVWRMPLVDDYRRDLDSDIADMKNIGTRWGGAIYAALYLREFVGKDLAWAHLDIAGTGRADGDHEEVVKGGSGVAARTLLAWVERRGR
ncbi:MAG: leucyl aminopeptidase [Actinomycetota bacterium]|nr:leucyl aminopeptidase [Actinomycetota bacterium]